MKQPLLRGRAGGWAAKYCAKYHWVLVCELHDGGLRGDNVHEGSGAYSQPAKGLLVGRLRQARAGAVSGVPLRVRVWSDH